MVSSVPLLHQLLTIERYHLLIILLIFLHVLLSLILCVGVNAAALFLLALFQADWRRRHTVIFDKQVQNFIAEDFTMFDDHEGDQRGVRIGHVHHAVLDFFQGLRGNGGREFAMVSQVGLSGAKRRCNTGGQIARSHVGRLTVLGQVLEQADCVGQQAVIVWGQLFQDSAEERIRNIKLL